MKYQVNIDISAGLPFCREFYITNPDLSPIDITGATVTAYLAKHPCAFFATDTTSEHTFYNYILFTCYVVDGVGGVFSLNMSAEDTIVLEEGKYVYSVNIIDANGVSLDEVVGGPAFVSVTLNTNFGTIGQQTDGP